TLIFLDSRTAYFTHTILVMLTALIAPFPLEFIFMQLTAGIVGIDSIKDLSRRSQLVRTAVLVFVAYSLSFFTVELMHNGSPKGIPPVMFGYFAINAIFICFAYILIFVLEKLFGFTSRVTLVELSDINNPLLRTLSEECPGTFQHSMAVSNLASAAASRIGADVQLVRAGALYHDIGKTVNPAFFTENQHGVNPHDVLDPMQSARIVIGHVTDGLRLAEKAKLPQKIKDFISQHHGRGTARYFYTTYCNSHPDEEVDPAPFTYPGPNPQTRETSLLMMADSVEAASRSLTDHSPAAIQALVNRIIDAQVAEGLHNESTISFRDVSDIKEVFASRLRTMFHSRISYPEKIAPKPASPAPTESETPGGSGEQR
ncbi:MAG: HDIG domain-containing protein, partial [Paramuribaculum sp.]|nr:HDIG domain-containing protein [Paramuribaculum sp.]